MRLVNDQIFVEESAPAHEVQAFDLDAAADQLIGSCTAPFACAGFGFGEHFYVVVQSAHPRAHFFFFGTWQETNVFAYADRCARHDDFGVTPVVQDLCKTSSKRHQSFTRARRAG